MRVVEDRTKGIAWDVHPDVAAITFTGLDPADPIPWTFGTPAADILTVFPRSTIDADVLSEIVAADVPGDKAVLVPADAPTPSAMPSPVRVLRCPDRLADIDKSIEDRLLKSRISRG